MRTPAAVVAQQYRCVAAAVLEHQYLAAGVERGADRVQHLGRKTRLQWPFAHIDYAHVWRLCVTRALRKAQGLIAAGARVVQGFQRRRGAAKDDRHIECFRANDGEVTCVIADTVKLLVATVVFFVDNNEAGLRQRHKYGRAGTHDHPRLPICRGPPRSRTFVVVEPRMQGMHRHAQALLEAAQHLRGEADLRHQY